MSSNLKHRNLVRAADVQRAKSLAKAYRSFDISDVLNKQ